MKYEDLVKMSVKELKDRLKDLNTQAQAAAGKDLDALLEEATTITGILDDVKNREKLAGIAKDAEGGAEPTGGEKGEEVKDKAREKRGQNIKDGKAVKFSAKKTFGVKNALSVSQTVTPTHSAADVKETFNDVSSLVDRVTSIPLNGGETYQRGYVKSYGDGAGGLRILGTRQSGLTVEGADDFRPFLTKRFVLFEFLGRKASSGRQRHDIHAVGHIGEKAAPADGSLVRIVEPDDRPIMVAVLVGAERGEVTGIQSGIVFAENRVFDCDFLVLRPVVARGARRCCEQKRRAAEYVAYRSFHDSNDNGLFLLAVPPQTGGHVVGSPEQ